MPTVTEYFGYGVVNFGPLTTTWTAPASCVTDTYHLVIAAATEINKLLGPPTCGVQSWGDCVPSGAALDAQVSKIWEKPTQGFVGLFSPGLVCPSGWTTAGSAAPGTVSGEFNLSGVLTEDPFEYLPSGINAAPMPPKDIFLGALDPQETMVFCCPSGYKPNPAGACLSSVGTVTETTICYGVIPESDVVEVTSFDGSSWSPILLSVTDVTAYSTFMQTIPTTAMSQLVLATQALAVVLVHQASDIQSSAGTTISSTSGARPNAVRTDTLLLIPLLVTLACVATGAVLFIRL